MSRPVRAVVLAAGKGTRMRSTRAKVLHPMAGRPMLWHVLRALRDGGVLDVTVVANAEVAEVLADLAADAGHGAVRAVLQEPQIGTGHAVSVALAGLEPSDGTVLVVNGDMPLVEPELIAEVLAACGSSAALVTARMPVPSSFGRVVRDGDRVARIVEARDASEDELALDEMNAGLYAYDEKKLRAAIAELRPDNAQGEYYLTDTIAALVAQRLPVVPVVAGDFRTVLGVNDRIELAAAAALLNRRICERHMRAGVTIADPATTYLEPDLEIAGDVSILPNTTIGHRSKIGAHSEIGPNARVLGSELGEHVVVTDSLIVNSRLGDFVAVGPWAHIRGGAELQTGARIGNFVEVKASTLAPGVKAMHLSYVGDSTVGERTNIGAGTITCNFDGEKKNPTRIGKDVFIGTNTLLVAPIEVGDGALTGAGSVVIRDVPAGGRVAGNPAKPIAKPASS